MGWKNDKDLGVGVGLGWGRWLEVFLGDFEGVIFVGVRSWIGFF